jgi:hypothetical protein
MAISPEMNSRNSQKQELSEIGGSTGYGSLKRLSRIFLADCIDLKQVIRIINYSDDQQVLKYKHPVGELSRCSFPDGHFIRWQLIQMI